MTLVGVDYLRGMIAGLWIRAGLAGAPHVTVSADGGRLELPEEVRIEHGPSIAGRGLYRISAPHQTTRYKTAQAAAVLAVSYVVLERLGAAALAAAEQEGGVT